MTHQPSPITQTTALARALGDTPESTISVHLLARGLGRGYAVGRPASFAAALVQEIADPREPVGFGADADALWSILRALPGWECVSVPSAVAPRLGRLVEAERGRPVRYYGDVYHRLDRPAAAFSHALVRQLGRGDAALLDAAPAELRPRGWEGSARLLAEGIAAAAVVDQAVVAIAFTSARTVGHADIAVATLEPWRGRGLATAAASLVAARIQAEGQTPVWSTGEGNLASLRIAEKIGFVEVGRRTFVIPAR
ncbi:MAG TPA: GNAT family N-acetyltransferase [Chloroflexota bacterium]